MTTDNITANNDKPEMEPLARLTKDLKQAAAELTTEQARFLVDNYYAMQEQRKRSGNQMLALTKSGEPHRVIDWLQGNTETLEKNIKAVLDRYSMGNTVGKWSRSVTGIGPVIAAGLLAYVDIEQASTDGKLWRYAGLDPTVKWEKGQKRPWNAGLKTLCWKIGEAFVKVSGLESDVYGKVWAARKALETKRNDAGAYVEQARAALEKRNWDKTTDAYKWYSGQYPAGAFSAAVAIVEEKERMAYLAAVRVDAGTGQPMLPPAHVHARAKRYAVKLFLTAWREAAWFVRYGQLPVKPYVMEHLGHVDYFEPPNMELVPGWAEARRADGRVARPGNPGFQGSVTGRGYSG